MSFCFAVCNAKLYLHHVCVHVQTGSIKEIELKLGVLKNDRLAERLSKLNELDALPLGIKDVQGLDDGFRISETLKSHEAVWHETCFDMCNADTISRAVKRKNTDVLHKEIVEHSPVKEIMRRSIEIEDISTNRCFFCNEIECGCHRVKTLSIDDTIRHIATELQDSHFLTKLT